MLQDMINRAAYMAHGYCLLWKPWLVAIHASSDILIFGSYFAIPVAIWIFLSKRKDLDSEAARGPVRRLHLSLWADASHSGRNALVASLRNSGICESHHGNRFGHNRNRDFPAHSESGRNSQSEPAANRQ